MRSDVMCKTQLLLVSLVLLTITMPVQAALDELFRISFGASIERYNTEIKINSRDNSIGEGIDLENDIGFDPDVNAGWISGWYRVADNHRLKLTYTPIRSTESNQISDDIVIGGTTIKSGAALYWDSQIDIYDFSYIYSVYSKPNVELGLSAGLYWLRNSNEILASGEVIAEGDDEPIFKADYRASQKIQAPLPLIGIIFDYEIFPSWRTNASISFLSLTIDNIKGNILNAKIGTEYYFGQHWGVGASLGYFDLDVEINGLVFNNSFKWSHNGFQLYGVYKY